MSTSSVAALILFLQILWTLTRWYVGDKGNRSLRAQELSSLLAKISKEGDNLAKQIREELNQFSGADWDDIPARE